MKSFQTHWQTFCFTILFALAGVARIEAQEKVAVRKGTLGIGAIAATPSLKATVEKANKTLSMGQVLEALDSQFIDRFNATRKFQIVAVGDLKDLIKQQGLAQSGNFDANDPLLPQAFKLAGTEMHLITSVDGFQDIVRKERLSQETSTARELRLSVVAKLYSTETGKLRESASFQIVTNKFVDEFSSAEVDGNRTDDLLVLIAREMADKVANRVADVVFPAMVVSKRDKQIMFNRGDGAGITVGQMWEVYSTGDELIDPGTGESLGKEEVLIGKARVKSVQAKVSSADLLEDNGVVVGHVLRLPQGSVVPSASRGAQ